MQFHEGAARVRVTNIDTMEMKGVFGQIEGGMRAKIRLVECVSKSHLKLFEELLAKKL